MPSILSGQEISSLIKRVVNADSGKQEQPAGYDVSVNTIHSFPKDQITLGVAKGENSTLNEVTIVDGFYELNPGAYFVTLNEITTIPKDAIGILLPRSTLLRNGLDVRTALFDPGYSGQPKVMLVCHRPARIQKFSRIGQLVIIKSDKEFDSQYSGQYQGEKNIQEAFGADRGRS